MATRAIGIMDTAAGKIAETVRVRKIVNGEWNDFPLAALEAGGGLSA